MKSLLLILSISLLTSCGKSSQESQDAYTSAYGTTGGRACESNVISDYNKLSVICSTVDYRNFDEVKNCIDQTDLMLSKYPGIECRASRPSKTTLNDETIIVNSSAIKKLSGEYTHAQYLNYKGGTQCGRFFMWDMATLQIDACVEFDFKTIDQVRACERAVSDFLVKYDGFNCSNKTSETEVIQFTQKDFEEIRDALLEILK